jgi:hypothetical protein
MLGWLWSRIPLGPTMAWRMNMFSALAAAAAGGTLYLFARRIGQWPVVALVATLVLATSATFWTQVTRAEVWGLAALLQALLLYALIKWRDHQLPLWLAGLVLGLAFAHHRTSIFLVPGVVGFVALSRRPRWSEIALAGLAVVLGCLPYLYLLRHTPPWQGPWQFLVSYASGNEAGKWLDWERLRAEGLQRPLTLFQQWIWPQFFSVGAVLALLGSIRVLLRDRALALLLLPSYVLVVIFCTLYFAGDVEVFFIPAHIIAALLVGEGAMLILGRLNQRIGQIAALGLLVLPILLFRENRVRVDAANDRSIDMQTRAMMAQPLPPNAVVMGDWEQIEALHYLQAVEGQRPDMRLVVNPVAEEAQRVIMAELEQQRSVFLVRPRPEVKLAQWPNKMLWQVGAEPPSLETTTPSNFAWADGIKLSGYTLGQGPFFPGEIVPVTLDWTATATPSKGYITFVHILNAEGAVVAQHDRGPAELPTEQWQPGAHYADLFGPTLHPTLLPGRYTVTVGWYEFPSLAQLNRVDRPEGGIEAVLGTIEIVARTAQ